MAADRGLRPYWGRDRLGDLLLLTSLSAMPAGRLAFQINRDHDIDLARDLKDQGYRHHRILHEALVQAHEHDVS